MSISVGSVSNTPTFASRTNSTITAPSGITNGDLLVAVLHVGDGTDLPPLSVTPPAGWTEVTNSPSAAAKSYPYTVAIHIYYKVASGESGNYTFTHTTAETEGYMYRLTGADTSTPIDATPAVDQFSVSNGQTTGYASVTTATNGAFLIFAEADWDGPGSGTVSGSTPTITVRRSGSISWIGDGTQTAAGATGARTRTNGNSHPDTTAWSSIVVPIRPTVSAAPLAGKATVATAAKATSAGRTALAGKTTSRSRVGLGIALQLSASSVIKFSAASNLTQQSTTTSQPILVSATSTAFNTTTTPKALGGIAVQNGDVLIAHAMMEQAPGDILSVTTTSGSTSSWTLLADVPGVGTIHQSYLRTWAATATATGTVGVSFGKSGGSFISFGGTVKVYRNSGGVGAVQAADNATGSGAPSITITTTRDHSVLDFACADWNGATGTAVFTSSAGAPVEDLNIQMSGLYSVYSSHVNAGSAGSKTTGMSSPSGQRYVAAAVEIFGLGQVGSLVARAGIAARAKGAAAGKTRLSGGVLSVTSGASALSGRLSLAGSAKIAARAGLISQLVILEMQTRFMPAMRGTLSTKVALGSSSGTAFRVSGTGAPTARIGLTGRTAAMTRWPAGVSGATAITAAARTAFRAGVTFSGRVTLAMQTRFFPAMRGALNAAAVPTSVALAATAAAMSRAKAAIAGRTALTTQTLITSQAPGRMSAIAALATRSVAQVRSAAAIAAKTTLSAAGSLRAAGRGAMIGTVALAARTISTCAAAVTPPGQVVELLARATTAVRTTAGMVVRTSLSAKTALKVKASTPPAALQAFLAAATKTRTTIHAATVASAALATSGAVKIGTIARATFSGTVLLGSRAKASVASRMGEAINPVAGRAMVRASARALLSVLRPVIPTPVHPRPGRHSRLRASLERAFGEEFNIEPMTAGVDVNSRVLPDISRDPKLDVIGIWMGPTTSRSPIARGSTADDKAHNWNVSFPSVRFDDEAIAGTRKGDRLTRQLDGSVWYIERVVPDGFGRSTVQLTSRKRTTQ